MSTQKSVTVIVPIKPSKVDDLRKHLLRLRNDTRSANGTQPDATSLKAIEAFQQLADTVHYFRWTILDESSVNGDLTPPQLVFTSNFDESPDSLLLRLIADLYEPLVAIYDYCIDFPQRASSSSDETVNTDLHVHKIFDYLKQNAVKSAAYYIGSPGRTVVDIKQQEGLRDFLRKHLNSHDFKGRSAREVHQSLRNAAQSATGEDKQPLFPWLKKTSMPTRKWPYIVIPLLPILIGPAIILAVAMLMWAIWLQLFHERRDRPITLMRSQLDEAHMATLETYEDYYFQNQFSQVLAVKPGWMRLVTLKFLLFVTNFLSRIHFVKGKLMGIPTIHFAKWIFIDDNKRVFFSSNFDGSWQQYLCDFIDKCGKGLSAVFSNTQLFPKTWMLIFEGAYDEEHFLAWSRLTEIDTQVWYSAYPNLSIKNINNNGHIYAELMRDLDENKAKAFLKRF
ncbi:hypothetical protein [Taibaiella soli]|uniref:Uncharacterized protein n=1 Tax=Taibaiella soli TaxID=1649169 RepID=A0A2W2AXA9_9BACT|nr:hypothetical protein [Taibaiella soli]PZF72624.1 hypothetical protein DN068_12220 [Taibaiella soli]